MVAPLSSKPPLSIEELLALHPWPERVAQERRDGKCLEFLWHFDLPGDPEALWRVISDTSRLNRALGVGEMIFEPRGNELWGKSRNGGVQHEWVEVPWNWVAGQWLTSSRVYQRGFSKVLYAIQHLERLPGGCRLYLYFGAVPRHVLGSAALRLGFPSLQRGYHRVLPAIAAQLERMQASVLQLPAPELPSQASQRLDEVRAQLLAQGLEPTCVASLLEWIRTGDEADLYRIQIRERARAWDVAERDLLRVALHATRAGVLSLSWDTICPHCRGVTHENPALGTLRSEVRCDICEIEFTTAGTDSVEVTFHVHPSIREVAERHFCSAEPATKDHIRVQLGVPAGRTVAVTPELKPGRYRMRKHGERSYAYLDVSEAATAEVVAWSSVPEETVRAAPGAAIEISNPEPEERLFIIEDSQWTDFALRPGHLLSLRDFRDLFSEDYVAADVHLAVGQQTLLFTDVVGSTAFYAERGDPGAFVEIKKHFDEVFAIVAQHHGVAIKTIGDAVMAAFVSPLDAVRASRAIHDTFAPSRADTPIRLRISLNTGPCIAVRFNANIDYFGGTVNIAAKLQSLAESWQVAMSESTYQAPGVSEFLAAQGAELVALSYTSKALPEPVPVRQWTVYRAEARAALEATSLAPGLAAPDARHASPGGAPPYSNT